MKQYNDDKFRELLGDKLRTLREEPPADMFDRIEQTLMTMGGEAEEPGATTSEPKVVPLWGRPWVRGIAAAMVAAMLVLVSVVALRDNAPADIEIVAEQIVEVTVEQPEVTPIVEPTEEPTRVAMVTRRIAKPAISSEIVSLEMDKAVIESAEKATEELSEQGAPAPQEKRTTPRERKRRNRTRSSHHNNQQELEEYWRVALAEESEESGGWLRPTEVGLYAANVGFNRGHIERSNMANSAMMVSESNELLGGGSYMSPSLVKQVNSSNLEHFMPITVGVTLSFSLGDWLSVDSGLLYTNIYSKSDNEATFSHYERRRTFDYLGVPLALSAYFADFDRLSLYGRLGATTELCIGANDVDFMDGEFVEKVALDVPSLTFSLDAAVGASYALWGAVGLFGEVGCSYWMAPQGYAENYRTVNPLSLSTRFGLRFTFN